MKILHLTPTLDPAAGGVVEAVLQLSRELNRIGVYNEIACLDSSDGNFPVFFDFAKINRLGRGIGFYGLNFRLAAWIRSNCMRFDAIIVHGLWQFHGLAAVFALIGKKIPLYIFPHGMLDPWFRLNYPIKHLKKKLYWLIAERLLFKRAKLIFFTSEEELLLSKQTFLRGYNNLVVSGFGIEGAPVYSDLNSNEFLEKFPSLMGKRFFLYLGRVHEKKGCDVLISAFCKVLNDYPDIYLVIAGPGSEKIINTLKRQIVDFGSSDKILWVGMLSGRIKWDALKAAEIFVLISHQENFGISVVESLAVSTPVIISNKVNIWREIESSRGGLVCDDTVESAESAIRQWVFAIDNDQRSDYKKSALQCFDKFFRIRSCAEKIRSMIAGKA